jgi:hypothetical protein
MNPNDMTHSDLVAEVLMLKQERSSSDYLNSEVRLTEKKVEALVGQIASLEAELTRVKAKMVEGDAAVKASAASSLHTTAKVLVQGIADRTSEWIGASEKASTQRLNDTLGAVQSEVRGVKELSAAQIDIAREVILGRAMRLARGE